MRFSFQTNQTEFSLGVDEIRLNPHYVVWFRNLIQVIALNIKAAVSCNAVLYSAGEVKIGFWLMGKLGRAWVGAWVVHGDHIIYEPPTPHQHAPTE